MVNSSANRSRLKRRKGLSILSVLVLISIVMVVAAAMTGVFTMNMNITQRAANGSIALAEAEAGVTEVLYQVTREENVPKPDDENPRVEWGLKGETLRSTITPEMGPNDAYHVVTFNPESPFPYSTNNTTLDNDTGYMGRVVPDGMIHVISTGYCKGQYRTVECVIEKPPFPFGLATSGPVVSIGPITIKGTSNVAAYQADSSGDRPGHLVSNSREGITIGKLTGRKTEISGFVKSSGPVAIAQPAVVRGGIRTYTDASTFTDINIEKFNVSGEGVVTLVDDVYSRAQNLDVMYHYSGPGLHYLRGVNLKQALLYVDGNLTIDGPVTGEGLIVVNGNAQFKSGTTLSGTNKMAVLVSGDATISGSNNFFTGLVYCEGNLQASNITILGTTIVNSSDKSKGGATLQNVTVVANEETRDMTIRITTGRDAGKGGNSGDGIIPSLSVDGGTFGFHPAGLDAEGHYDTTGLVDESNAETVDPQAATATAALFDIARDGGAELPTFEMPPAGLIGRSGGLWDQAKGIYELAKSIQDARKKAEDKPGPDATDAEIEQWKKDVEEFERLSSADERSKFEAAMAQLGRDIIDYRKSEAADDGSYKDGLAAVDIVEDVRFNLNEYLPESERVKISFWKVYSHRL